MKITSFYTVTFLVFLLASFSMAVSKFISSVSCCSAEAVWQDFSTARCSH